MAERQSPLGAFFVPGDHGNAAAGVGVTLRERKNLSIVQVTAWIDTIPAVLTAIGSATGLVLQNKPGLGRVAGEKVGLRICSRPIFCGWSNARS